jgi:hypothetical protein
MCNNFKVTGFFTLINGEFSLKLFIQFQDKLTPQSRILLAKLEFAQFIKNFGTFYGTRRFIIMFIRVRHCSLSSTITSSQRIHLSPRPCLTFRNMLFSSRREVDSLLLIKLRIAPCRLFVTIHSQLPSKCGGLFFPSVTSGRTTLW